MSQVPPQPTAVELSAAAVEEIFIDCLFRDGEPTQPRVMADGIRMKVGFHPERLNSHRESIGALLAQLPPDFMRNKGGGSSFLCACITKDEKHWGEHANVEQLLVLGLATKQVEYIFGKEIWPSLPGGMPYFEVIT